MQYKIRIPDNIKKKILAYYKDLKEEHATFLFMRYNKNKEFLIYKFEVIPEKAIEMKNLNLVKISPKYIKYILKKSIKENFYLLIVHNHINPLDIKFSLEDLSLIKTYSNYLKKLGGKNFFSAFLINNSRIFPIIYENQKFKVPILIQNKVIL